MTTYIEIHALQSVPPSNLNRDDTGTPKTALYGGVLRHRVSSQSWKHAVREDFNSRLDLAEIGTRSRLISSAIADRISALDADLGERALDLACDAMEAAGFKRPAPPRRASKSVAPTQLETGYLVFLSQRQIEALARAAVAASTESDPKAAMKAAKVKSLVDAEHSIDIALFGRMVADSADLNVEAACQVAHAISVHEATPEFDFFTAVDDTKSRNDDEADAGAGMMGTVGFVSSTLYRYAAINLDQLRESLGVDEAVDKALEAFLHSFLNAMPAGKQNTFAHTTRPAAVIVTVATGQPTSLVGAFEKPVRPGKDGGYLAPAIRTLAAHAREVFETWRTPAHTYIVGLPSEVAELADLGKVVAPADLASEISGASKELV